jgi:acyl-CoA hydrolase
MEGRPVKESYSTLSELALPNDANGLGTLLGGKIMHLVDIAGAIAANRHSRQFVVTASFDHMDFLEPVRIGQLVTLHAAVNRAFRTSMEVGVKVFAEDLRTATTKHVASAYLTFVALDENRNPQPVPPALPETAEEKRRYDEAGERREYRLALLRKRRAAQAPSSSDSPSAL